MSTQNINRDAELSFLGALLLQPSEQLIYIPKLKSDEFYTPEAKIIIPLMVEAVKSNRPFGIVELSDSNKKEMALNCISKSSLTVGLSQTLLLIWQNHTANLARKCGQTIEEFSQNNEVGEEYFVKIQNILNDYNDKIIRDDGFKHISEILSEWFENKIKKSSSQKPYYLPFSGLDKVFVENGHLASVVARSKSGKTTFLTQIALDCINKNVPVLFFTLEDTKDGILDKLLALKLGVNLALIKAYGKPDFVDNCNIEGRIARAISEIENAKIGFVDGTNIGIGEIRAITSQFNKKYQDGVVIIDQLQHIKHKEQNKIIRYDSIVESLKDMAQTYKVKLFLAHQMNREIEKAEARFPVASDIKDCGRVEEGSDLIVMFAKEKEKLNADRLCTIIARHQTGKQIRLKWQDAEVRFTNA